MKALLIVAFVLLLAVIAIVTVMQVLVPITEVELCFDRGGRWNDSFGKCECTREELSSPTVTKDLVAHCDKPLPPRTS